MSPFSLICEAHRPRNVNSGKYTRKPAGLFLGQPSNYSIDGMTEECYQKLMAWEVEYTDEFGQWWEILDCDNPKLTR